jgi:hypothetical protein
MQAQPDGNQHCIQFWRTGNCQWVGRCRFPHQCYVCGSPAHGTAQHSMSVGGGGMPPVGNQYGHGMMGGGMPPPVAAPMAHPGYGVPGPVTAPAGAPVAGDWQCTGCGWGNYPERQSCRKCMMPRPAAASQALAAAGANLQPPDGKQHCIQFWRTGNCQWLGRCRYPHQCQICGSPAHGTGQHASMAVATATASAAVASVGAPYAAAAPPALAPAPAAYEPTPYSAPAPAPAPAARVPHQQAVEVPLSAPLPAALPDEPAPTPAVAAEPPAIADVGAPPPSEPAAAQAQAEEERGRARSRSKSPVKKEQRSRSRSRSGQRAHSPAAEQPAQ